MLKKPKELCLSFFGYATSSKILIQSRLKIDTFACGDSEFPLRILGGKQLFVGKV